VRQPHYWRSIGGYHWVWRLELVGSISKKVEEINGKSRIFQLILCANIIYIYIYIAKNKKGVWKTWYCHWDILVLRRDQLFIINWIYIYIYSWFSGGLDSKNGYKSSVESNSRQLRQQRFNLIHKSSSDWLALVKVVFKLGSVVCLRVSWWWNLWKSSKGYIYIYIYI
jgi:hypothetical protein